MGAVGLAWEGPFAKPVPLGGHLPPHCPGVNDAQEPAIKLSAVSGVFL